jgi:hypothetical protein
MKIADGLKKAGHMETADGMKIARMSGCQTA